MGEGFEGFFLIKKICKKKKKKKKKKKSIEYSMEFTVTPFTPAFFDSVSSVFFNISDGVTAFL